MRGIPNMGMRNQVFPSIIHRLVAFTPFSAPESHQSNGMRAWNIHMPFSQSVERLPPICSISAANCLRPWPPGRLPECQAPISFTSVISKKSSSPEPTPRTCLRKAHDAKRSRTPRQSTGRSHPYDRHTDARTGPEIGETGQHNLHDGKHQCHWRTGVAHRLIDHQKFARHDGRKTERMFDSRHIRPPELFVLSGHVSARSHVSTM